MGAVGQEVIKAAVVEPPPGPAAKAAGRLGVLWLVLGSLAVIVATTVIMRWAGVAGWDTPAHLYKIAELRQGGSLLWDNEWYGGAYQMVSYGVVFYWLAQFVNYSVLVVASAAVLPVLFYTYMRRVYDVTSLVPAVALAGVLAVSWPTARTRSCSPWHWAWPPSPWRPTTGAWWPPCSWASPALPTRCR